MKKFIAFITAVLAIALLAPIAEAGHSQRRVVGYNQCGDPLYATYRVISYQRCGTPNYGWVRDRSSTSCSRPGRCNHHGHAHSTRSSGLTIGYASPRVSIRSNHVRHSSPSRSSRSSSSSHRSSRSRSCR